MAVILIAGTIPGLPALHNKYEVHLISNTSKLWTTITALRPSLIIIDDNIQSLNARKFCKDCKQNKSTQQIALMLVSDNSDLTGYADAIIKRSIEEAVLHATIEKILQQSSLM